MAEAEARAFILKLGSGLHTYGYPSHRLEDALLAVSHHLGIEAAFFSAPTALFASFGAGEEQRTHQIRASPAGVDLGKLSHLDAVADDVAHGRTSLSAGASRVDAIVGAPPPYGPVRTTLAFALASGAAGRFLGGGAREIAAAALIGLVFGLLDLLCARIAPLRRVFEAVAATMAGFLATALAHEAGPLSVYVATVSGLIVLVPGFPLTVALIELATQNLVSGTARFAGAVGTFLAIGFGVALGRTLAARLLGAPHLHDPVPLPGWTLFAAMVVAGMAFTILLKAELRDAPWIMASGLAGFLGARLGVHLLGPEVGSFLGALFVGTMGNVYARLLRRPAVVPIVPGLLLLVPGSIGFLSLSSLMGQETVAGIEAAVRMIVVAISLATGVLFSNVVFPAPSLDR
jgi:uncharacterized membrane protein YjjP (DUF1212 family)